MRALITGVGGFAGGHLARHLLEQGLEVHGAVRPGRAPALGLLQESVALHEADLLDKDQTRKALEAAAPELVFHLAAQPSVALSWKDPEGTILNNVMGQLHVLEALVQLDMRPRVLVVSSNEVYGAPASPDELPLGETLPLRPSNPYAVSKAAQDLMGYQYFVGRALPVVRVRPFNHLGPGQSDQFAASGFARQIAEAEAGQRAPVLRVGNLEAQRDFSDVRDIVRGYYLALTRGQPGEVYNLASGRAVAIRALLDGLLAQSRVAMTVEVDPLRYRPVDIPCVYGDASKLRAATGWATTIPLEQTLKDVLEYWRVRVASHA
ncbi:MAG: GDP-mannose 4,6-dehydratase [Chloroflexi bacterium]|nr:GDP-mannose 4,6-dehydratase [Chloroflexota bacterium]